MILKKDVSTEEEGAWEITCSDRRLVTGGEEKGAKRGQGVGGGGGGRRSEVGEHRLVRAVWGGRTCTVAVSQTTAINNQRDYTLLPLLLRGTLEELRDVCERNEERGSRATRLPFNIARHGYLRLTASRLFANFFGMLQRPAFARPYLSFFGPICQAVTAVPFIITLILHRYFNAEGEPARKFVKKELQAWLPVTNLIETALIPNSPYNF